MSPPSSIDSGCRSLAQVVGTGLIVGEGLLLLRRRIRRQQLGGVVRPSPPAAGQTARDCCPSGCGCLRTAGHRRQRRPRSSSPCAENRHRRLRLLLRATAACSGERWMARRGADVRGAALACRRAPRADLGRAAEKARRGRRSGRPSSVSSSAMRSCAAFSACSCTSTVWTSRYGARGCCIVRP